MVARSEFWLVAEIGEWPIPSNQRMLKLAEVLAWICDLPEVDQRITIGMSTIPPGETQPIVSPWLLARGLRMTEQQLQRRFVQAVESIARSVWWTKRGAHLLLQTRTRALDGTLRPLFEKWYPGLANDNSAAAAQAVAA